MLNEHCESTDAGRNEYRELALIAVLQVLLLLTLF